MGEYDSWFIQIMKEMIDAVDSQDTELIQKKYQELSYGIQYENDNPGNISKILIRMGQGLLGPVIVEYKFSTNQESEKSYADMNELQKAITNRHKNKAVRKMSGSLSSLLDYEDSGEE